MSGLDCRGSECAIWILLDCQKTYVGPLLWGWITPGALLGTAPKRQSSRDKVSAHRKRLRAQGLRPLQIWVPDTRSAAFKSQAHRQSLMVARSAHAQEDQDFIDAISGD